MRDIGFGRESQIRGINAATEQQIRGIGAANQQQIRGLQAQRLNLERGLQQQASEFALNLANRGLDRQLSALGLTPTFNQLAYDPATRLLGVGGAREAEAAQGLQDLMSRWNYYQTLPQRQLDQFLGRVAGGLPAGFGTSTGTESTSRGLGSRVASGVGGALLGHTLFGGGLGTILGGIGGIFL